MSITPPHVEGYHQKSTLETRAKYILFEGTDGIGKTTQCQLLAKSLRDRGYKVLETKEPGSPHLPLTMELREIMLNASRESQMTMVTREYISNAIRACHLEKLILPALDEYDYIIQDRGLLSGLAYGEACGNYSDDLVRLAQITLSCLGDRAYKWKTIYDLVFYMKGDVERGLKRARNSKQEFAAGDAIENKGVEFMKRVQTLMDKHAIKFESIEISFEDHTTASQIHEFIMEHFIFAVDQKGVYESDVCHGRKMDNSLAVSMFDPPPPNLFSSLNQNE